MTVPPLYDVSGEDIERVVGAFYREARVHPDLGPIFAAHVADRPAHEAKTTRFWRNAIRRERCYDGNPKRVHMDAGDVRPEHFALWLETFDTVLERQVSPGAARSWSALAHRIGRGLRSGLTAVDGKAVLRD